MPPPEKLAPGEWFSAFTLAEVLITLGIIGVVAALTMPSIVANYKKQETVSRLKKAYTIANQTFMMSQLDNGEYDTWDTRISGVEYINKYFLPYFNVVKVCENPQDCGYSSTRPFKNLNAEQNNTMTLAKDRRIPFLTADGIVYIFSTLSGDEMLTDHNLYIDINSGKGPNMFGKDVFTFKRLNEKGILPVGYELTDAEIKQNCSKTATSGTACAAKIMRDGWQILDDYPF